MGHRCWSGERGGKGEGRDGVRNVMRNNNNNNNNSLPSPKQGDVGNEEALVDTGRL